MKQKENECEIVEKILDKLKYNITDDVWKKRYFILLRSSRRYYYKKILEKLNTYYNLSQNAFREGDYHRTVRYIVLVYRMMEVFEGEDEKKFIQDQKDYFVEDDI